MGLRPRQLLIAEVKTKSPFGWEAEETWDERFAMADKHGDWVAVHTEEPWGGSMELLEEARARTNRRLLAIIMHENDKTASAAMDIGANAVMAVDWIPKIGREKCIVEPSNLYELRSLALSGLRLIWNSCDLRTGKPKIDPATKEPLTFDRVLDVRPGIYCQTGYIHSVDDVSPRAKTVLVGTHLPEFVKTLPAE